MSTTYIDYDIPPQRPKGRMLRRVHRLPADGFLTGMGTTGHDPICDVLKDDGGLGAALADLERRIAAWSTGIVGAHAALTARTTAAEQAARGAANDGAPAPAPQTVVQLPPATRAEKPKAPPQPAAAPAQPPAASPPPASPTSEAKAGAKRLKKLMATSNTPADVERFAFHSEPPAAETPPQVDEDEALLATLDPKKAREIRIKRRLCNNTKSVRQLLDEK